MKAVIAIVLYSVCVLLTCTATYVGSKGDRLTSTLGVAAFFVGVAAVVAFLAWVLE